MNNIFLKGKKILFIGPVTYQYHTIIKNELVNMGAKVDFFGENTLSVLYRTVRNLSKVMHNKYLISFRKRVLLSTKYNQYDYIFLIRGDLLSNDFLKTLKELQPTAYFIMYQWDSVKVFNYLNLVNSFDVVFSFDPADCQKYGFRYLPLFYDNEYKSLRNKSSVEEIDLLFIGTIHSDRLKILKQIDEQAKKYNLITSFHLYVPFFTFIKNLVINRDYEYNINYLMFTPFNKIKLLNFFAKSKTILDINNISQSGLTMRTVEALGAGKKLITTNMSIQYENFYHQDDIFLLDRKSPILNLDFLKVKHSNCNYDELSLKNWIITIFDRSNI